MRRESAAAATGGDCFTVSEAPLARRASRAHARGDEEGAMGSRRQKGGRSEGTPAGREGRRAERASPPREASDPREEEGYSQPESSAQKGPTWATDDGAPGHPE